MQRFILLPERKEDTVIKHQTDERSEANKTASKMFVWNGRINWQHPKEVLRWCPLSKSSLEDGAGVWADRDHGSVNGCGAGNISPQIPSLHLIKFFPQIIADVCNSKRWSEYIAGKRNVTWINQPCIRRNGIRPMVRAWLCWAGALVRFLWVFEPFGIVQSPVKNINLFMLGYGMVTSLVVIFTLAPYFKNYFNMKTARLVKISAFLFQLFFIGIANLLHTHFVTPMPLTWFFIFHYNCRCGFVVAGIVTWLNIGLAFAVKYCRRSKLKRSAAHSATASPGEIIRFWKCPKDKALRLRK